uniref:Uncharacterized protein n=1 Tax=Romanomermis culicivorax TaxID=13658 RepID=A0A915J124_ROMCU
MQQGVRDSVLNSPIDRDLIGVSIQLVKRRFNPSWHGIFHSGPPEMKLYGIKSMVVPLMVHNFRTMEFMKNSIDKCCRQKTQPKDLPEQSHW